MRRHYISLLMLTSALFACEESAIEKPKYPSVEKPVLHTTISADGEMIAGLLNAGTDQQILKIRNLARETKWRKIKPPPFTRTIRFGSKDHVLLLTYRDPESKRDVLIRWNMDKPESAPEKLYEASELAFPVEVSSGEVMVRTRASDPFKNSSGQSYLSGYYWILVSQGQQVRPVGPRPVLPYSAPNIVENGFFWVEQQMGATKDAHPKILSYPLPGGTAPSIQRERYGKYTHTIVCDQKADRCLRRHIRNFNEPRTYFVYGVDVLVGSGQCSVPDLDGFSDGVSITPMGEAAIMSLAGGYEKPRHVVVMRFKKQQCEPVEIQHINFEEG